jgi:homoserine dehydrogenase|tara:strand:+ start:1048 stop:2340 length:1293 start_codon:yes stop_codon:yes gene_type:complete
MAKKQMNIAIVGLGNIGSYLYLYLNKNIKQLTKKTNVIPNILFVSAKNKTKKRKFKVPNVKWENNFLKITKNKKVDIVVELIGGSEGAAKKLVFESLRNGKHVVTANKALVAKYGDQLAKIAEKNKVNLEFEAAVCGGVPIVRSIKEGLIANKTSKVHGIFNGTSNFILSEMLDSKLSFKQALSKAQDLGYAETNPSSDLNGEDVASKLKILTSLCFNSFINNTIYVEGINNIDHIDIENADKLGFKIKLLGVSELKNNKIIQRVHPCMIRKNSYIASIDGVLNAIIVKGKPVGESVIQGEGAGPEATTSALISDISSILRGNIKYPFSISNTERKNIKFRNIFETITSSYIRLDVVDKHGVLSQITNVFAKNKVSIKRLIQNPLKSRKHSSIVVVTHSAKNKNLLNVINQLKNKKYIVGKTKLIRIEEN